MSLSATASSAGMAAVILSTSELFSEVVELDLKIVELKLAGLPPLVVVELKLAGLPSLVVDKLVLSNVVLDLVVVELNLEISIWSTADIVALVWFPSLLLMQQSWLYLKLQQSRI